MAPAHELEHRASLQALADRWRVHPEEWTRRIASRLTPSAKAGTDPGPRAERADDLRVGPRRETRQRRANAREPGGPLVAEAEREMHPSTIALGDDVAAHRAAAPFASCASTT
jgi:hypothetical protein